MAKKHQKVQRGEASFVFFDLLLLFILLFYFWQEWIVFVSYQYS